MKKQVIIGGGSNAYSQFKKNKDDSFISSINETISPPIELDLDTSLISSYSVNYSYAVMITKNGEIFVKGKNINDIINSSQSTEIIHEFTKIEIKDVDNNLLYPISVYCGRNFILYLASTKKNGGKNCLIICTENMKWHPPIILNIGNTNPVAIFGGMNSGGSIDSEGNIIFISEKIIGSPYTEIKPLKLPDNEKAVSIAFTDKKLLSLSSNGKLYIAEINRGDSFNYLPVKEIIFHSIKELEGINIVSISGYHNDYLAVSDEYKVYGYGCNYNESLGIPDYNSSIPKFELITSLQQYKIISACIKVLACGKNSYGELLLSQGKSKDKICLPIETVVDSGATYCIARDNISAIFVNFDAPNCPNRTINSSETIQIKETETKTNDPSQNHDLKQEITYLKVENSQLKTEIERINQKLPKYESSNKIQGI